MQELNCTVDASLRSNEQFFPTRLRELLHYQIDTLVFCGGGLGLGGGYMLASLRFMSRPPQKGGSNGDSHTSPEHFPQSVFVVIGPRPLTPILQNCSG